MATSVPMPSFFSTCSTMVSEPHNMQENNDTLTMALTPRLELIADEKRYTNINDVTPGIEYQKKAIRGHMFTDVFLSFEGITKQMTVPEVQQRIQESMTRLGLSVGRMQSDVLQPVIERTITMLAEDGRLPDLPDEMRDDPSYEIEYTSMLALAQQNSRMTALQTSLSMAGQVGEFFPEALDKIDSDQVIDSIWAITGADVRTIRDDGEVAKLREARQSAQVAEQQRVEQLDQAQLLKTGSEANKNMVEAEAVQ